MPVAQAMQAAMLVAAMLLEYKPALHVTHAAMPSDDDHRPAAQDRHVTEVTAPTVAENVPAEHAAHDSADVAPV